MAEIRRSPQVVALLPAHDEELDLPAALASLRAQTRPPDRTIVIVDACTDGTAAVATACGVETVDTLDNTTRKAGALKPGPGPGPARAPRRRPAPRDGRRLRRDPRVLAEALAWLHAHPGNGAVGGVFAGRPGGGLVGALQRNEYARYAREVGRRGARATVLTGAATLFRVRTLHAVAAGRGTVLPGRPGPVDDTAALTEDNGITLAVRTLGLGPPRPGPATCTPR